MIDCFKNFHYFCYTLLVLKVSYQKGSSPVFIIVLTLVLNSFQISACCHNSEYFNIYLMRWFWSSHWRTSSKVLLLSFTNPIICFVHAKTLFFILKLIRWFEWIPHINHTMLPLIIIASIVARSIESFPICGRIVWWIKLIPTRIKLAIHAGRDNHSIVIPTISIGFNIVFVILSLCQMIVMSGWSFRRHLFIFFFMDGWKSILHWWNHWTVRNSFLCPNRFWYFFPSFLCVKVCGIV